MPKGVLSNEARYKLFLFPSLRLDIESRDVTLDNKLPVVIGIVRHVEDMVGMIAHEHNHAFLEGFTFVAECYSQTFC